MCVGLVLFGSVACYNEHLPCNDKWKPLLPSNLFFLFVCFFRANSISQIPGKTQLYPSVTTVLSVISKKFVTRWETNLALQKFRERLSERLDAGTAHAVNAQEMDVWMEEAHAHPASALGVAGGFGTTAHALIEDLLSPERAASVVVPPEYETVVQNFVDWKNSMPELQFLQNEMIVHSDVHGYAGAVDAVGMLGKDLLVLDWKTSNRIYSEYALQVAAYAKAYEEMTGASVAHAWVVRFDKSARKPPQIKAVANIDQTFQAFVAAKTLWTYLNQKYAPPHEQEAKMIKIEAK